MNTPAPTTLPTPQPRKGGVTPTVFRRFWSYVAPAEGDACWLWTGDTDREGYGTLKANGRRVNAHRLAYSLFLGPIPTGRLIRHTCDNKLCVNPDHLIPGTPADNARDMHDRRRARADRPKLTPAAVADIRRGADRGETRAGLARRYGVAVRSICRVVSRTSWRGVA